MLSEQGKGLFAKVTNERRQGYLHKYHLPEDFRIRNHKRLDRQMPEASGCLVTSFSDAGAAADYRFLDTLGSASLKI